MEDFPHSDSLTSKVHSLTGREKTRQLVLELLLLGAVGDVAGLVSTVQLSRPDTTVATAEVQQPKKVRLSELPAGEIPLGHIVIVDTPEGPVEVRFPSKNDSEEMNHLFFNNKPRDLWSALRWGPFLPSHIDNVSKDAEGNVTTTATSVIKITDSTTYTPEELSELCLSVLHGGEPAFSSAKGFRCQLRKVFQEDQTALAP